MGFRKVFFHPGWRIVFCFFPSQNQFLKLTNSCCFCTLHMGLQSWCVIHVCTCVCVCVCMYACVCKSCVLSGHFGDQPMKVQLFWSMWAPASSTPDPFLLIYWETVLSTNFSVPDGASGFFSPLTLVKNVFWEPWESFGVIMDLFKTKQSQDIEKILKKKKKRKTRTEMMKSFENIFVTYLIFKKNLQYQPHKLLTISWGGR